MMLIMTFWALDSKKKEAFTKFGVRTCITLYTCQLGVLAFC